MTGSTQPRRDAAAKTITDSIPGKKMTCGILPPPASWPATKHGDQQQHLLSARSAVLMGAERAITANIHNDGFDEEMKVNVPGREANFMVRVAGRELASTGGIVMALHGGGYTSMSWAPVAALMKRDCCVLSPDLRGHGLTTSADDQNLSLDALTEDVISLLAEIVTTGALVHPPEARQQQYNHHHQQQQQQQQSAASGTATGPSIGKLENSRPMVHNTGEPGAEATAAAAIILTSPESAALEKEEKAGTDDTVVEPRSPYPAIVSVPAAKGEKNGVEPNEPGAVANTTAAATTPPRVAEPSVDARLPAAAASDRSGSCCAKVLIVGHSLGGSIAVRVAAVEEELKQRCQGMAEIGGVVAVDVVEGTALAALDDMPELLRKIPARFESFEEAVAWHMKTGAVRRAASAPVVVPSRFKDDGSGTGVVWRTDLAMTEKHWRGWFEGLSSSFLDLSIPKLLIVAGMDRLDPELTAAHMQGKFQLKLVYGCGHSIQEDQPRETTSSIMSFAFRHSILRKGKPRADDTWNPSDEEELARKLARARGQR